MESSPNWARILSVLYRKEEPLYRNIKGELTPDHDLVKKSGLTVEEVERSLAYLRDQGLVESSTAGHQATESGELQSTHIEYEISRNGFKVAHDREMNRREDQTNRMLLLVTVGLFASALIQAIGAIYALDGIERKLAVIGAALILLFVSVFVAQFWRSGWLDE